MALPHISPRTVLTLLCTGVLPALAHASPPSGDFEPGDVIVHWKANAATTVGKTATQVSKTTAKRPVLSTLAGLRIQRTRVLTSRASLIRLSARSRQATLEAMKALAADPRVAHVEPNYIRRIFRAEAGDAPFRPDDEYWELQWNLRAARLDLAWNEVKGNPNVVVAIIDTGLVPDHPDLAGRTLPYRGWDFISDPENAGDGDGRDMNPTDEGNESMASSAFHGTHVAGVVAASGNNGTGIAGVDWACKILPVRALGVDGGKGRDSDIAAAIRWAAGLDVPDVPKNTDPARIINLSFGGPGASQLLSDAIKAAQDRGAIVVAAAGNYGGSISNIYPAVIPDVVTVGSSQLDNARAPYSCAGPEVEVMAPGGDMSQTLPGTYQGQVWTAGILGTYYDTSSSTYTYEQLEGTSQAAPLVAGVISLMLTVDPTLQSRDVIEILQRTADPVARCDEGCGAGLIDAYAALEGTRNRPGGPPIEQKLPFSFKCSTDSECTGNMCREVYGVQICTQPCPCPRGATCTGEGLCDPDELNWYTPGQPNSAQLRPTGIIYGSGCAIAGPRAPHDTGAEALLLLFAMAFLIGRRAR